MIKHSDIISKLTEAQKLRLVTDFAALGDDELNALGVPRVVTTDLDEINQKFNGKYPSFFGLANSWNRNLFGLIASDLSYRIGGEANLIDTPPMRTKSSVYVDGVSEDPYLTRAYAESLCGGIEGAGAASCLTDCSVREVDVGSLDKNVTNGVLADFLIRPFLSIGYNGNVTAIKSSPSVLRRNHSGVGEEIEKLLRRSLKSSVNIVFSGASQDTTVATMPVANELVCNTPLSALRAALDNYHRLKDEVERGTVSVSELNKAFADGVAVSEEMLDAAVDKVIDFAWSCYKKRELLWHNEEAFDYDVQLGMLNRRLESEEEKKHGDLQKFRDGLALLSVQESIVMLKNVNAMPVSVGRAKVAVIGELGEDVPWLDERFRHYCKEAGGEYLGYSRGYSEGEERNDEAFRAAVKLAQASSTVVMFMGLGKREKSLASSPALKLPANQLALFDAISDLEKNVIVVIRGDFLPDMQFDDYCAGVLFCPLGGTLAADAICSVIFGKYNPSGRLCVSGYSDVDGYHKTLRDYKVSGKNKVGEFLGYRHYTSNGTTVKYPFGFGLSFSKFEYSAAKLEGNSVTLTVRNTSKVGGHEVVQLYVGKKNSALIRPVRELKGFVKVFLRAKEKKRITIPFSPADFKVYDPADVSIKFEG
ncbi:MAG: glycoside hydrolase family 3 C-terminal domain-containing protein [Clostridiales bacterium]|nr:glycoside hydrolase family 3 C-terminal domain-containing protein [Clostridiales bacterium]